MSKKAKDKVLVNPNCEKAKINDYHRFTEKDYGGYKLSSLWCGGSGADAVQKLGQLEDLLEKYGITYLYELEHLIELAHKYEELDVEKKLKALEIIKRDCPNITLLLTCKNYARYLVMSGGNLLKEDYDFLREVLLWKH